MADKKQRTPERQIQVAERAQRIRESALSRPAQSLREAIGRVPEQTARNVTERVAGQFGYLGAATLAAVRTPGARFKAFTRSFSRSVKGDLASSLGSGQIGRYLADKIRRTIPYDKNPEKNFQRMKDLFQATSSDIVQIRGSIERAESNFKKLDIAVVQLKQEVETIKREQGTQQRLLDQLKQFQEENKPRANGLALTTKNDKQKNIQSSSSSLVDSAIAGTAGAVAGGAAAALSRLKRLISKFGIKRSIAIISRKMGTRVATSLVAKLMLGAVGGALTGGVIAAIMAIWTLKDVNDAINALEEADREGDGSEEQEKLQQLIQKEERQQRQDDLTGKNRLRDKYRNLTQSGRSPTTQAPRTSSETLAEKYARMSTNMDKQQFLAYGQLPRGFENVYGHMGILGSPGAVMARGAMPLGQFGGGGTVGGYGGMPSKAAISKSTGKPLSLTQQEAYNKVYNAAAAAGSPDPHTTASIAMLESGYLKSSMTQRANNPFGQTIRQGQIGTNGIIGGTRGADGQLHAVYDSLESAMKHHLKRWGNRYVPGDQSKTLSNLVKGSYNVVDPNWSSKISSIYERSRQGVTTSQTNGGSTSSNQSSQGTTAAAVQGEAVPPPTWQRAWADSVSKPSTSQMPQGEVSRGAPITERAQTPGQFATPSSKMRIERGWITAQSDRNWNQCVALSRAFNPNVGRAAQWKVDPSIPITPGSMIASTQYGTGSTPGGRPGAGYHTGIALTSPDRNGNLLILDQSAGMKAVVRQVNINSRLFGGQAGVVKGTQPSMAALQTALSLTNNKQFKSQIEQSANQLQQQDVKVAPLNQQQTTALGITTQEQQQINQTISTTEIAKQAADTTTPPAEQPVVKEPLQQFGKASADATQQDTSTIVPMQQFGKASADATKFKYNTGFKPFSSLDYVYNVGEGEAMRITDNLKSEENAAKEIMRGLKTNSPNSGHLAKIAVEAYGLEESGPEKKMLQEFFKEGKIKHDPEGDKNAWCAIFVAAVAKQAGMPIPKNSSLATNWSEWGTEVPVEGIKAGDVFIKHRGLQPGEGAGKEYNGKKIYGHLSIATGKTRKTETGQLEYEVIEGNHDNTVSSWWAQIDKSKRNELGSDAVTSVRRGPEISAKQRALLDQRFNQSYRTLMQNDEISYPDESARRQSWNKQQLSGDPLVPQPPATTAESKSWFGSMREGVANWWKNTPNVPELRQRFRKEFGLPIEPVPAASPEKLPPGAVAVDQSKISMFAETPKPPEAKTPEESKFLEANVTPEQPKLPELPQVPEGIQLPGGYPSAPNAPPAITGLPSEPQGPAITAGITGGPIAGETVPGKDDTASPAGPSAQQSTGASAGSGGGGNGVPELKNNTADSQAASPGSQGTGSFGRCFL